MDTTKIEQAHKKVMELKELNKILERANSLNKEIARSKLNFRAHEHYGTDGEIGTINQRHTNRILELITTIRDEIRREIKDM